MKITLIFPLVVALCGCSKQQPAAASRWKTSFNSQTWSVQHWSATGYRSWNLDWCDGFTADPKGELKAIVLTGPVAAPTGMRYGHRWVPRYWHSGYTYAQVSEATAMPFVTAKTEISATNAPEPTPYVPRGEMMDPLDNQFNPHPELRPKAVKAEDEVRK